METGNLLKVAMRAGELLLCNGAEVYRVEETITRIFKSYGKEAECFVLLSGIFITAHDIDGKNITIVKRLKKNAFDLKIIELVNSFSRRLEKEQLSFENAMQELDSITSVPTYDFKHRIVFAGFMAFVYILLLKGSYFEALVSFPISALCYLVKSKISEMDFLQYMEFFISGVIASGLSILAAKFFPGIDIYKVIIGSIMIIVPGMAITTALKDALYGDIVSSLYRITEAVFISAAIGSGAAIMLSIGLRYL